MTITIDLEAYSKEKLAVLPDKMLESAFDVLVEKAFLIVNLAQVYCPVRTGALRSTIRLEIINTESNSKSVRISVGDSHVNYAGIVEAKQPFMRPAFEQIYPEIEESYPSS